MVDLNHNHAATNGVSSNGALTMTLEDVHKNGSGRKIALNLVGISDIQYPLIVIDRDSHKQQTIAKFSLGVDLPKEDKGAHMSRFVEILSQFQGKVNMAEMPRILDQIRTRLDCDRANIQVTFPYFLERSAPVSGATALMDYECSYSADMDSVGSTAMMSVRVPVASLCPCSKAISDYGAHNQRGYVTIEVKAVKPGPEIWLADLIEIAEKSASAPVYPILKRPDERYVTMQAYENPAFVEDIVREAAWSLTQDSRVLWCRVNVVNHESIHNHNVFGSVEWHRFGSEG